MLEQADDFKDECDALDALIAQLSDADYERSTQFKDWTIDHIIQHLHFFNLMADLSLTDEIAFTRQYEVMRKMRDDGGTLTGATDHLLDGLKGTALRDTWRDYYAKMAESWRAVDPKQRVVWVGPTMSARSSITARLMETWAHGQAIYDLLGVKRQNTDRIKNIAIMGVNTFGWTFKNRGEEVPATMPYIRLEAPSGAIWDWGEQSKTECIEGSAEEFCQVVTQTRNIADTGLVVTGETANRWMAVAQCFAGPPRTPPPPGARFRAKT